MPGLKYITVPEEVVLKDLMTDKTVPGDDGKPFTVSFKQFILRIVGHESFLSSFEVLRSAHAIADVVQHAVAGTTVTLAEDDWNRLVDGVKQHYSTMGMTSLGMLQLMPYFDAVLKASDSPS
jgi:hypothetical protein